MARTFGSLEGALVVGLGEHDSNSSLVRTRCCVRGRLLNSPIPVLYNRISDLFLRAPLIAILGLSNLSDQEH